MKTGWKKKEVIDMWICTECGLTAEEDDYGKPKRRECHFGGWCEFITIEEARQNEANNDRDDYLEDMRLFNE